MAEAQLSGKQDHVIGLLLAGQTQKEAATEADVTEETVSRWINHDPLFVATLNARREDLWRCRVERLRGLADKALDVYEEVLDGEGGKLRLQAARDVLRSVAQVGRPEGPTDERDVATSWARSEGMRKMDELLAGAM